jgi:hypothetical protein
MSLPPPYLVTGHGAVVGEAIYLLRELLLAQAHLAPAIGIGAANTGNRPSAAYRAAES